MLEAHDLQTVFHTRQGTLTALFGVNLNLPAGKVTGLVGESGCGKSVTALSIMRLLGRTGEISSGQVLLEGRDLLKLSEAEMERVRGSRVAMIFQQPRASLNPVFPVEAQLTHVLRLHRRLSRRDAGKEAEALLARVGFPDPRRVLGFYPHQLSGGMCQRVMICQALACGSAVLLADEPTTALDVTIQIQIVDLLKQLQHDLGLTVMLITHDLGLVAEMCDHVSIMYAGRVVESAPVSELFRMPTHPYTRGLMASRVRTGVRSLPKEIPGRVPDLHHMPSGCPFHPRCPLAREICAGEMPETDAVAPAHAVRCHFWREGI